MKKSLFALAATTAIVGAAQAQSSVTVYGLLDVGYVGANSTASNSAGTAATGYTNGVKKTVTNQFGGVGAENTSRLGFKGTEDLGGGKSAFFTIEFALNPEDQVLSGSGSTVGGLSNRQTFVGLKKNGLGSTAIGLQYTPVFNASAATSPTQQNNVLGDVIYAGTTIASTVDGAGGTVNASFTNRTANSLTFQSDKFAGFGVSALFTMNNTNATNSGTSVGGNTNASGYGLGADYTWNKLLVTAAYQNLKQVTSSAIGTVQPWTGAQPSNSLSTTSNGENIQDSQFLAGATYDFGILKAYAQYVSRKASNVSNSSQYLKRSAEQIGVRSYITPAVEAWASAGLGRYTAYGTNNPTANFNAWQLGSNYYLSKRTNLYAIYGQQVNTTAAVGTANGSASANNYAIGVRHSF